MSCGTAPGRWARGLALLCLVLAVAPATAQIPPPVRDTGTVLNRSDTAAATRRLR